MATTTNYGWTTPDDTALVKDGAAAIRTLGSSVDTTTKALNPSTTLGDIEYRSSTANTNTRLAIGTTGQVLSVSGGVPAWATPSSGGMTLINAGGTTLTGASISFTSIAATYNNLQLIIRNFRPSVDTALIALRFNNDSTASRYLKMQTFGSEGNAFDPSRIDLVKDTDNGASQSVIVVDIYDYANTTTWKCLQGFSAVNNPTTTTQVNFDQYTGFYNQTGAISEINLISTSGNFTSGTAYLYGVK